MNEIVIITILVSMFLLLIRAIRGKTVFDRILAGNSFGTKTVMLIVMLGFVVDSPMFLDIAFIYALINFIATVGFLKFFSENSLGKE